MKEYEAKFLNIDVGFIKKKQDSIYYKYLDAHKVSSKQIHQMVL